jgi:uncharacterized protein YkwD
MGAGASAASTASLSDEQILGMLNQLSSADPDRAARLLAVASENVRMAAPILESRARSMSPAKPAEKSACRGVVMEMNAVRTDPKAYADKVEALLGRYEGLKYKQPQPPGFKEGDPEMVVVTNEGAAAVSELVTYLRAADPISPLDNEQPLGLVRAAQEHVADIGPSGEMSHDGSDKSKPADRMSRHGEWKVTCGENISFGETDAEAIVLQLLIDDGVPSRGHRTNIMNPAFRCCGAAVGVHKQYGVCCVIDYAGGYGEKVDRLTEAKVVITTDPENADVIAILRSLPDGLAAVKEKVEDALGIGKEVKLDYNVGSITAVIGRTQTLKATWT